MKNTMKRVLSVVLALAMLVVLLAGCKKPEDTKKVAKTGNFTYYTYTSALGNNWNPHTWETNADDSVNGYITSPFVSLSIKDSVNQIYQWVYDMATYVKDVTAENKADLTKYGCTLPEGKTADDIDAGYVYEIGLEPNAKWEDGTPINADSYIYSMKMLLDPEMKNYRANLYYAGESAVAGGDKFYYQGDIAYIDNYDGENYTYTVEDLVKGDDGVYAAADGTKVFITIGDALTWLGGYNLATYVGAYGDVYFGMDGYAVLEAACDDDGRVAITDETLAALTTTIGTVPDWGEDETCCPSYFVWQKAFPSGVDYDATVGCYKVDDYTIRYVNQARIDINYFLTSLTSTWLVYGPLYEAGFDTTGTLKTTNYGTSMETSMSYGPYKFESFEADKQMVFVQNENWYGWEKDGDYLVSWTNFEVDGEIRQQYQTTKYVIDVMENDAAKNAFLKGDIMDWTPEESDLVAYSSSDRLYKVDETYTESFFFNTNVDMLKEMDNSKGNTNSVVLSNDNFRWGMSYAIDRAEYVTATAGWKPAYSLMNSLYYYNVYEDPNSIYRSSDEAMSAICKLYNVEYGEGTPYATLKDAYKSINGYNLTLAKDYMKKACDELVAAGLYTAGEDIYVRIGWAKGNVETSDSKCLALLNKFVNAALEGSGFGKITFEAVGNIASRYAAVPAGEYAIGYGAWGGAAFYPFRNFQVYCDPDQYDINEAADWDPTSETLTINIDGKDVTNSWQTWSQCMVGTGAYADADFATKLAITATMEYEYLKKIYRIPLATTTSCFMMSYKTNYYTEDYNIMYDFGGARLMSYNYTDEQWADFVAANPNGISYE